MGIAAIGAVGVHHSRGPGEDLLALMVVGNDQVDAKLVAQLRLCHGGDAAVYGDDELDSFAVELADGNGIQTVAFFQTAGDVADHIRTVTAEKIRQQTGGSDAVHVVISEDGDSFSPGHGKPHPAGSQVHVGHQEGVQQGGGAV